MVFKLDSNQWVIVDVNNDRGHSKNKGQVTGYVNAIPSKSGGDSKHLLRFFGGEEVERGRGET